MRRRLRIILCVGAYALKLPAISEEKMKKADRTLQVNMRLARSTWGPLSRITRQALAELLEKYSFSVVLGDIQYLDRRWYVTHAGLLRLANRYRCSGIRVSPVRSLCEPTSCRWVFKATVFSSSSSRGFVGYGDADPSNTSPLVRGSELRIAETRAVNRALRKAYGIGLCSVEELRYLTSSSEPAKSAVTSAHSNGNGSGKCQFRLRDQLCLLIRQHNLDPTLVKRYAADFCGTQELKEANRDLVESFITQIAESAKNDRDALVCKLNSYAQSAEANL
jgi:hypothetical protein